MPLNSAALFERLMALSRSGIHAKFIKYSQFCINLILDASKPSQQLHHSVTYVYK